MLANTKTTYPGPFLHFTVGPVKGFVNSARKVRDFWAGSFLLSWLTAIAMQRARQLGMECVLPEFPKELQDAMEHPGSKSGPRFGKLPNRFTARFPSGVTLTRDKQLDYAHQVAQAVQDSWAVLSELVWEKDIHGFLPESTLKPIKEGWDKQIKNYFEVRWCITDSIADGLRYMPARALWRTNEIDSDNRAGTLPCMLIDGLQELSGKEGRNLKKVADKHFWSPLLFANKEASDDKISLQNDIRPGEMLSAVAFVKRRFLTGFAEFNVAMHKQTYSHKKRSFGALIRNLTPKLLSYQKNESQYPLSGWGVEPRVPSLAYIAISPWLSALARSCITEQGDEIQEVARLFIDSLNSSYKAQSSNFHKNGCTEQHINMPNTAKATGESGADIVKKLMSINGAFFYHNELKNPRNFPGREKALNCKHLVDADKQLTKLKELVSYEASPYLAMLTMDGDKFGDLLKILMAHSKVDSLLGIFNEMLTGFTNTVQSIVKQHNGFLVFVGGEDVLAFLPAEDAIDCAQSLHRAFVEKADLAAAMIEGIVEESTTIPEITASIAVCFCHYKVPLKRMVSECDNLLSRVAKTVSDRNSIAISAWTQSNNEFEYFCSLADFFNVQGDSQRFNVWQTLNTLKHKIFVEKGLEGDSKEISSRFFYKTKQRLVDAIMQSNGLLNEHNTVGLISRHFKEAEINAIDKQSADVLKSLIAMDYFRSCAGDESVRRLEEKDYEMLMDIARVWYRNNTKNHQADWRIYQPDALLLLRFVAWNYKEEGRH